jgi:hypothetical protein
MGGGSSPTPEEPPEQERRANGRNASIQQTRRHKKAMGTNLDERSTPDVTPPARRNLPRCSLAQAF